MTVAPSARYEAVVIDPLFSEDDKKAFLHVVCVNNDVFDIGMLPHVVKTLQSRLSQELPDPIQQVLKLVAAGPHGHYTLPAPEAFVDLMPSRGEERARIRFRLAPGIQLDIPLSEASLLALSRALLDQFPHRI